MLTFIEAIEDVSSEVKTIQQLRELVADVSGEVLGASSNSTHLLYSGQTTGGSYASNIGLEIKAASSDRKRGRVCLNIWKCFTTGSEGILIWAT